MKVWSRRREWRFLQACASLKVPSLWSWPMPDTIDYSPFAFFDVYNPTIRSNLHRPRASIQLQLPLIPLDSIANNGDVEAWYMQAEKGGSGRTSFR